METVASRATDQTNQRRSRPSRARGLRTSTGCLTCRKRRVKCDESKPQCSQCSKGGRGCTYVDNLSEQSISGNFIEPSSFSNNESSLEASNRSRPSRNGNGHIENSASGWPPLPPQPPRWLGLTRNKTDNVDNPQTPFPALSTGLNQPTDIPEAFDASNEDYGSSNNAIEPETVIESAFSPLAQSSMISFSPEAAPFDWYQLLAKDALNNFEEDLFISQESNWDFDPSTLLPPTSYGLNSTSQNPNERGISGSSFKAGANGSRSLRLRYRRDEVAEPWNTTDRIVLRDDEIILFQHFTKFVGPILDLFDSAKHFSDIVPHLALRNTGLMKSMLAVAARHLSLMLDAPPGQKILEYRALSSLTNQPSNWRHLAVQYYYETLSFLSQAMQYPSYTRSSEILATAIMISTYEMFDDESGDWERHLKGAFWIQRNQDNDGESNGIQQAVWWAWLRQDIWAAFRHNRRTMTFWRPTKPLNSLGPEELACRSIYLLAKAIEFISEDKKQSQDLTERIEEGQKLIRALEDWHVSLPSAFLPVSVEKDSDSVFKPIWIHPPAYSAAVQLYCFAKIVILINMPSTGGIDEYHERQKTLDDAVDMICGLAQSPKDIDSSRASVSVQCLFVAGQCTRAPEKQEALQKILEHCLSYCKWLQSSLIEDLKAIWYGPKTALA